MSDIAIRVEGLGKQYRIGGPRARYRTIRESVIEAAKAPFRRLSSALRGDGSGADGETIWALKDVSFEVERGEVVGIIGRNGAGKSTLLKVLSRITEPTEGWAEIHGRVGSLLEVGTGFHPELTGRENIYLSGAVLGMRREEIDRRFDEIVAFAEIGKFVDTPVKHYSSGMYVRLAFAVAAHLEPEVLLIDEVLAVGDAAFQRKCLGKMDQVAQEGRTVLFVSHNMAAVSRLCRWAFLLSSGRLVASGASDEVVQRYLTREQDDARNESYWLDWDLLAEHQADSEQQFVIRSVEVLGAEGGELDRITTGDTLRIRVDCTARRRFVAPAFVASISDRYGVEVARLSTVPISGYYIDSFEGEGCIELLIEEIPFLGGQYLVTLGVARANVAWVLRLENVLTLNITPNDVYGSGIALDQSRGVVALKHRWVFQQHGSCESR
jgi:lipopolysaccharide transport system ATP-binding protein